MRRKAGIAPYYRQVGATLVELFFGLTHALGFIPRHAGLGKAFSANPATIFRAGDGGGEAAE